MHEVRRERVPMSSKTLSRDKYLHSCFTKHQRIGDFTIFVCSIFIVTLITTNRFQAVCHLVSFYKEVLLLTILPSYTASASSSMFAKFVLDRITSINSRPQSSMRQEKWGARNYFLLSYNRDRRDSHETWIIYLHPIQTTRLSLFQESRRVVYWRYTAHVYMSTQTMLPGHTAISVLQRHTSIRQKLSADSAFPNLTLSSRALPPFQV